MYSTKYCKFAKVNSTSKKIVIASPNFLVSQGIGAFFQSKGVVAVSLVGSQDELEKTLIKEVPDIVLIDDHSEVFKIEKTIAFLSFTKPAKTILLTNKIEEERISLLKKVGVKWFISRDVNQNELNKSVVLSKVANITILSQKLFFFSYLEILIYYRALFS